MLLSVVVELAGETSSDSEAASLLRRFELRGWARRRGDRITVLAQGSGWGIVRLVEALNALDSAALVSVQELPDRPQTESVVQVFSSVKDEGPTIQGVLISEKADTAIVGALGRVDHRGHLLGWAVSTTEPGRPCSVRLTIDDRWVVDFIADSPRSDLPARGVGHGTNGIDVPVPADVLDGSVHRFVLSTEDELPLRGQPVRELRVPARIDIPSPAPWIQPPGMRRRPGPLPPATRFEVGRQHVLGGELDEGFPLLRDALDQAAALVFRDTGLTEYHRRTGSHLPSMRERMSHRWQVWYGPSPCDRGAECCKLNSEVEPTETTCPRWPRLFESKARTKRWAQDRGLPVPETYATTTDVAATLDELPHRRFVLKPVSDSGKGLYLMHDDVNLFDRFRYSRAQLLARVEEYRQAWSRPQAPFLVEELLVQEGVDPALPVVPLDYKLHVFGGRVRLIHVDDRNRATRDPLSRQQSWYARDWTPAPLRLRAAEVEGQLVEQPSCYEEMLTIAEAIGAAVGAYVRVDMYATTCGAVLGEVTTHSFGGYGFTAMGDLIFAQLWDLYEDDDQYTLPLDHLLRHWPDGQRVLIPPSAGER